MDWPARILEHVPSDSGLGPALERLLADQRHRWPALRRGEAELEQVAARVFERDGETVVAQANPGRRGSTLARVDAAAVAERPCFLCPQHMPAEERGLAFGELVLLPNPHPIVRGHLTVPARPHRPQRLAGRLGAMLALSRALGPDWVTFYNGPSCGASAPDHFHLQACPRSAVPLLAAGPVAWPATGIVRQEGFGRRRLLLAGRDPASMGAIVERAVAAWAAVAAGPAAAEPAFNLLLAPGGAGFFGLLFPRIRHRPDCFAAVEQQRIAVSPAALEMAGLLVVAEPAHLERLDAERIAGIYRQVGSDGERWAALGEALA